MANGAEPLTITCAQFKAQIKEICDVLGQGLEDHNRGTLLVNERIVETCFVRAESTVALFNTDDGINYYREAGLLSYWLAKLKPLFVFGEHTDNETQLVNEHTALIFAWNTIDVAHEEVFENPDFASLVDPCRELQAINYRNVEAMSERIANSLRYQVKAAGALPTLLEALFFLPVDDFAAWDSLK